MAMTGHADDCAACTYAALPAEDKAHLVAEAFTNHTRREPPKPPADPDRRTLRLAALASLIGFALAFAWTGFLFVGAATLVWAAFLATQLKEEVRRRDAAWRSRVKAWKVEQTEAWLAARAQAKTWPCPTCGSETCSAQHVVTETSTVRVGPFYSSHSQTDPV